MLRVIVDILMQTGRSNYIYKATNKRSNENLLAVVGKPEMYRFAGVSAHLVSKIPESEILDYSGRGFYGCP